MSAILILPAATTPGAREVRTSGAGSAVLEDMYLMVFGRGTAVTPRAVGQRPIVT
jgi:hypothetical protein